MIAPKMSSRLYTQILLTGATGALGPALAADLARAEAAERIAVLFRGPPDEIPARFARWKNAVEILLPPDEHHQLTRLHPIAGDICQANLGITDIALQREADLVIHAAADTNFASPQQQLHDVNVEGTRRTLQWAESCPNLRCFLLVSSVFVSGSRTGTIAETLTPEAPDFVTYYQHTKWQAEHVALQSGLPVGIARISLVLGSHATGGVHASGAVHSLIKWFSRGLVPLLPGLPDAKGDVIATETAAQCVTRAILADWPKEKAPICHIAAGSEAPLMSDLVNFVYDQFAARPAWRRKNIPRPQFVPQADFNRLIHAAQAAGRTTAAQALRSINRFLPDLLFPKTYATAQAEALLGGPLPRYDWRQTMARVIGFCFPEA